jgi:hypothetical protein
MRISAAVNRILMVSLGFVLASIAGLITLFWAGSRWAAQEVATQMAADSPDAMSRFMSEALGTMAFLFTVAPVLTLAPAVVAILVGELARIRSLLYYVLAGGAAAAIMPLIAARADMGQGASGTYNAAYFSIMATAGFAAGLVYWLLAGRRA